jgi:hypothetical protein
MSVADIRLTIEALSARDSRPGDFDALCPSDCGFRNGLSPPRLPVS